MLLIKFTLKNQYVINQIYLNRNDSFNEFYIRGVCVFDNIA